MMKCVKTRHIASSFLLFALLTACGRGEQMRQRLQFVAKCNRADTVFTERWQPTVDSLVNYFRRHGTDNERMMAYYLQGRVHHDLGEAPQALDCYQRATEQADTTRDDCDLRTLYSVYGQMSVLFHAQYLPDNEMKALQTAERIAWKNGDTFDALVAFGLRTRPYYIKGEKDSVMMIEKQARELYLKHGYKQEAAQAMLGTISILLDREQYEEANRYIKIFEQESGWFDSEGNILRGKEACYYDKGRYLLVIGQADSACNYFRKALMGNQKEAAYSGLLSVYEKKNIADSIAKYARLFAAANDSSYLHVNQEKVHQITAMYDYSHHQRIAEEKTAEARKANRDKFIIIAITVLLLAGAIFTFFRLKNRAKREYSRLIKELEEKQDLLANAVDRQCLLNYDYEKAMKEKDREKEEREFLISQHEEDIAQKKHEIEDLEANIKHLEDELRKISSVDMEAAFKKTDIFKLFDERKNPRHINNPPKEKDWQQLIELFRTHFVRYYSFIAVTHRLSVNQFRYCVLLRLGFDGKEIDILMNKNKDQRYHLRQFIYEELFGKPVQVKLLEEKLKQHY